MGRTLKHKRRGGFNLGPMRELTESLIISTELKLQAKIMVGLTDLTFNEIRTAYRNMIINPLRKYVESRIDIDVPSDTGDLRFSMKSALGTSFSSINNFPFRLVLNTKGIPYANPVNNMPNKWLKHPSASHRNIGRFGNILNDPESKKGWYNFVLINGRNRAKRLYKDYISFIKGRLLPFAIVLGVSSRGVYHTARSMFDTKPKFVRN